MNKKNSIYSTSEIDNQGNIISRFSEVGDDEHNLANKIMNFANISKKNFKMFQGRKSLNLANSVPKQKMMTYNYPKINNEELEFDQCDYDKMENISNSKSTSSKNPSPKSKINSQKRFAQLRLEFLNSENFIDFGIEQAPLRRNIVKEKKEERKKAAYSTVVDRGSKLSEESLCRISFKEGK